MFRDADGNDPDVVLFDVTTQNNDNNNRDKKIIQAGKSIQNLSNTFQVLAHGAFTSEGSYMRNVVNGNFVAGEAGKIKNADSFDKAFSGCAEWNTGKDKQGFSVILYACNTGRGENSLAAKISAKYDKINVIAPTRQLALTKDKGILGVYGTNKDGTINKNDPGYWLVYQKGKVVEAYDATWVPGTSTKGHKVDLKAIPKDHYNGATANKEFNK